MNDRFRFRVWNSLSKKLEDVCQITLDPRQHGNFSEVKGMATCNLTYQPHLTLEQCTGLKDKHGRLIYEGDIVLLDDTDSFENPIKTVVRWAKENASFGLFHSHNLYYGFFSYESENFEVIGNIHENADLLEEKSEKPIL